MKNLQAAKKILEKCRSELEDYFESDYERHRFDVLIRDLTEGLPSVVQVDEKHQRFNGLTFRKGTSGHYTNTSSFIHRHVWQYYCGDIPAGNVIHHKNFNKSDNSIENLQMLTITEHNRLHMALQLSDLRYTRKCPKCGKTFTTGHIIQIYCSEDCANKSRPLENKQCVICGKEFKARTDQNISTCSKKCLHELKTRQDRELPRELRHCAVCGKEFLASIVKKQIYCSKKCRIIGGHIKETRVCTKCGNSFETRRDGLSVLCPACSNSERIRRSIEARSVPREKRICPNCGKIFDVTVNDRRIYCSQQCSIEMHYEMRECPICGKQFRTTKSNSSVCCSKPCGIQMREQNQRLKKSMNPKPPIVRHCEVCGKEFVVPKKSYQKSCCSSECAHKLLWQKRHSAAIHQPNNEFR